MLPFLLKGVNKRRWDWTPEANPWLGAGDYPAAPFFDFRVSVESQVSFWHIEEGKGNLLRVVAALAAGRQNPDKFDYVLVGEGIVRTLAIPIRDSGGESADPVANERWHCDLVELTGARLVALIHAIHDHGTFHRVPERQVRELLLSGMHASELDQSRMNDKLLALLRG